MKHLSAILLLLLLHEHVHSQDIKKFDKRFIKSNAVELNAGGHGIFYSVAYERFLVNRSRYKLSAHIGISYYPPFTDLARLLWVPLTINHLASFGKHHAELGMGVMVVKDQPVFPKNYNSPYENYEMFTVFSVGYRHQKVNKPFYYKICIAPVIEGGLQYGEIHPMPSVSCGYMF